MRGVSRLLSPTHLPHFAHLTRSSGGRLQYLADVVNLDRVARACRGRPSTAELACRIGQQRSRIAEASFGRADPDYSRRHDRNRFRGAYPNCDT